MADQDGFDDDDVPPLEDMSELLQQIETIKADPAPSSTPHHVSHQKGLPAQVPQVTAQTEPNIKDDIKEKPKLQKSADKGDKSSFAGFKKGFLFGPSKPKSKVSKSKDKKEEIPFIKAKDPKAKDQQYQLPEVQEAMKPLTEALTQNKEWLSDDLLSKVEKNEVLMKRMVDPTFMAAMAEFQTNPQAASAKHGNNSEMQKFFMEFCGIMGNHFTSMGGDTKGNTTVPPASSDIHTKPPEGADISVHDPNQPTMEEQQRMQQILKDPEISQILVDPRIQALFEVLRKDPDKAQSALREADRPLQEKIRKLVEVGLLQIQR